MTYASLACGVAAAALLACLPTVAGAQGVQSAQQTPPVSQSAPAAATSPQATQPANPSAPPADQRAPSDPQGGSAGIGDIVVTAQRRSESLQKVPLAVSAISGDALEKTGRSTIQSLTADVPGLNVAPSIGQARVTIRGIGIDNISLGSAGTPPGTVQLILAVSLLGIVAEAAFADVVGDRFG